MVVLFLIIFMNKSYDFLLVKNVYIDMFGKGEEKCCKIEKLLINFFLWKLLDFWMFCLFLKVM